MGGSTVFGYEQGDGSVIYGIYSELLFDEIYGTYLGQLRIPNEVKLNYSTKTIQEYFSERLAVEEDSIWRILYKLDMTVHCKRNTGADVIVKFS